MISQCTLATPLGHLGHIVREVPSERLEMRILEDLVPITLEPTTVPVYIVPDLRERIKAVFGQHFPDSDGIYLSTIHPWAAKLTRAQRQGLGNLPSRAIALDSRDPHYKLLMHEALHAANENLMRLHAKALLASVHNIDLNAMTVLGHTERFAKGYRQSGMLAPKLTPDHVVLGVIDEAICYALANPVGESPGMRALPLRLQTLLRDTGYREP